MLTLLILMPSLILKNRGDQKNQIIHFSHNIIIPYLHKRGPMSGAPYIGPRLGDGPIFKVSVSQLDAKECPGKLPMGSS